MSTVLKDLLWLLWQLKFHRTSKISYFKGREYIKCTFNPLYNEIIAHYLSFQILKEKLVLAQQESLPLGYRPEYSFKGSCALVEHAGCSDSPSSSCCPLHQPSVSAVLRMEHRASTCQANVLPLSYAPRPKLSFCNALCACLNLLAKAQGMFLSPQDMTKITLGFKSMTSPERFIQTDLELYSQKAIG